MIIFCFIFGITIGSFLNVCIYRIPRDESIAFPPSHCTNCNNAIKFYDLIPVLSFILLRGKCRHCEEKISIRYPFIELMTGALITIIYIKFGVGFDFFRYSLLIFWMIVIGMIDYDTTDVYFKTTFSGIVIGIILVVVGYFFGYSVKEFIFGGIIGGGIIALIVLLTGGMGWGDVEVFLLSGLFLGLKLTVVALVLSFVLGGVIGLMLIALKKKTRKDYIPFAPFISIATILVVLIGDNIIKFYLNSSGF